MLLEKIDGIRSSMILDGLAFDAVALSRSIRTTLLVKPLKELFTCIICRAIVSPPTMITSCCKQIIGCKSCIDQLGQHTVCSHCRGNVSYLEMNKFNAVLQILNEIEGE